MIEKIHKYFLIFGIIFFVIGIVMIMIINGKNKSELGDYMTTHSLRDDKPTQNIIDDETNIDTTLAEVNEIFGGTKWINIMTIVILFSIGANIATKFFRG